MQWSCEQCGTVMKLWHVKCRNCKESGFSLLHGAVFVGGLLLVAVVLLKVLS